VENGKKYIVNSVVYEYSNVSKLMTKQSTMILLVKPVTDGDNTLLIEAAVGEVTAKEGLNDISIYSCDSNGDCTKNYGYIVAGTSENEKIYENFLTPGTWNDVTPSDTCTTAATHAGDVKINGSKIQLCIPASDGTAASFGDVANTSTYLFGKTAATFKLYKGNDSTSTIVIVEDPGNYKKILEKKIKRKTYLNSILKSY